MKKRFLIGLMVVLMVLAFVPLSYALPLPQLDYSGGISTDTFGNIITDNVYVNDVIHRDGTFDNSLDSILGEQVWVDNLDNPTKFYIGDFSTTSPTYYLTADILSTSSAGPGFYTLSLGNITIKNKIDSLFLDEFNDVISQMTSPVVAVTMGVKWSAGTNKYNVSGKLAPVPEPATLLLFGTGITGLGLVGWRRKKR